MFSTKSLDNKDISSSLKKRPSPQRPSQVVVVWKASIVNDCMLEEEAKDGWKVHVETMKLPANRYVIRLGLVFSAPFCNNQINDTTLSNFD